MQAGYDLRCFTALYLLSYESHVQGTRRDLHPRPPAPQAITEMSSARILFTVRTEQRIEVSH